MKIYYYVHTNQILGFDITDSRLEIRFMKAYGSKFSMSEILFLSVFHIMFLDSQNRFLETRKKNCSGLPYSSIIAFMILIWHIELCLLPIKCAKIAMLKQAL